MIDPEQRQPLAVLGLASIVLGLGLVLAGAVGLVPAWLSVGGWLSAPALALLLVAAGVIIGWKTRPRGSDSRVQPLAAAHAETTPESVQLGDQLETALESADEAGVRTALSRTAVTVLTLRTDCSRTEAANRLRQGTWTDGRIAAATLGDEEAPEFRTHERLLATLWPRRTLRHRAEHTIEAIEAIEPAATDHDQPPHDDSPEGDQSSASKDPATEDRGTSTKVDTGVQTDERPSSYDPQPAVSQAGSRGEESSDPVEESLDA